MDLRRGGAPLGTSKDARLLRGVGGCAGGGKLGGGGAIEVRFSDGAVGGGTSGGG